MLFSPMIIRIIIGDFLKFQKVMQIEFCAIKEGNEYVLTSNKRNIYAYLMGAGHLAADINQGSLSAILPFLIVAHNYDYATAATLVMLYSLVGSVVQPIFGQLADKHFTPWILPVSLFLANGGMALTGFASNFNILACGVIISGIGVAMFHPVAALMVNKTADKSHQATDVSIFSFGGTMGFTLGPAIASLLLSYFSLDGTLFLLLPMVIVCSIFIAKRRSMLQAMSLSTQTNKSQNNSLRLTKDSPSAFLRLCGVIFGRSIINSSINTFLVLYMIDILGQSKGFGSTVLSVYYACGSVSTLFGGHLADRYGYRTIIRLSFIIMLPLLILFAINRSLIISLIILLPIGATMNLCYSAFVVLGQKYLPHHMGFASGVTLGLNVSIGGIIAPFIGHAADLFGLTVVFYILSAVCVIPFLSSLLLPSDPLETHK